MAELATGISNNLEAIGQELVTEQSEQSGKGLLLCKIA